MHVQPQGALGVGVLADQAQPVAAGPLGEVEVGAVLQARHGVLVLHALQGAGAVRGEDARRRDLRVGGPVEQAVAALDEGPVGLRGGREGGARGVGLHGGAAHQALRQARIAEGGAAELLRGPGVAVEARGGVEGGQARRGHAEFRAPVRPQGEQEDGLGRHGGAGRGEAAAPGGPPGRDPVGGDEAGAVVADAIDEGLEQQGLVAVAVPEVVRQAAQAEGQRLGGEVAALRGGPHREAAEGRHAVQQAAALEVVPADPAVAVGQLQGGGGEAEGAEDAVVGDDQVAQLGAGVADGAPGMLGGDEFEGQAARSATLAGTPCGGGTGRPRRRGEPCPPLWSGAGSSSWPRSSRMRRALEQLASWGRPKASKKPNSVQTRRAMSLRRGRSSSSCRALTRATDSGRVRVSRIQCCWCRVGGVVAEPLPPQTRACASNALGSSAGRFAQGSSSPDPQVEGLACPAIRCRSVYAFAELIVSSGVALQRVCPSDASLPSHGSRRPRFPAVTSTMQALRLPAPHPFGLLIRQPVPRRACSFAPSPPQAGAGPDPLGWPRSVFRPLRVDCAGPPRFPGEPSRGYADVLRPRPARRASPVAALPVLPPLHAGRGRRH